MAYPGWRDVEGGGKWRMDVVRLSAGLPCFLPENGEYDGYFLLSRETGGQSGRCGASFRVKGRVSDFYQMALAMPVVACLKMMVRFDCSI